eukprot:jgi/Undpi1/10505/HiC_scaffold_29.g12955.m1
MYDYLEVEKRERDMLTIASTSITLASIFPPPPAAAGAYQLPLRTTPGPRHPSPRDPASAASAAAPRINKAKALNPLPGELKCVVHDREWVWNDILLVEGLESGCTVANVKARVSDLIGISGANMEVVIFEVDNGGHSSSSEDWLSFEGGGGSKSDGGGSGGGAISVCLWTPVKSGRDKRYLATAAANSRR